MRTSQLAFKVPIIMDLDFEILRPGAFILHLKYATTKKRLENDELDEVLFGLDQPIAGELLRLLRTKVK